MRLIWIVEMMDEYEDGWAPCNGSGLNIEDGKIELAKWRAKNPSDKFRLVQYIPK